MTPLDQEILNIEKAIATLKKFLPYADGINYRNDKDRIRTLTRKLAYWKEIKRKLRLLDEQS